MNTANNKDLVKTQEKSVKLVVRWRLENIKLSHKPCDFAVSYAYINLTNNKYIYSY